jgi:hypothetical protein
VFPFTAERHWMSLDLQVEVEFVELTVTHVCLCIAVDAYFGDKRIGCDELLYAESESGNAMGAVVDGQVRLRGINPFKQSSWVTLVVARLPGDKLE